MVTLVLAACLLILFDADQIRGQNLQKPGIEIAAGTSFVSGVPHRPRPPAGEGLSGAAGQDPGVHARVSAVFPVATWVDATGEVSYNRLESSMASFNCVRDDVDSGTCYPAAASDQLLSILAGARLKVPTRFSFYATVGAGVGVFLLEADERVPNVDLSDDARARAVVRGGVGATLPIGRHRIGLDAGLVASLGRGGGSHHLPLILTFTL